VQPLSGRPAVPSALVRQLPMRVSIPRFYAIIDPAKLGARLPPATARDLISAGVRLIQLRDKHASSRQLFETCKELRELLHGSGCALIVNDRADVARAADADGVHLGQTDLPVEMARRILVAGQWIGTSTHSLEQVVDADRTTADYIAFGPIFHTAGKDNPDPVVGLEGLRQARRATRKPLVAIGGISLQNAREVLAAGADSVAVIGGLLDAPDLKERAREFLALLDVPE